MGYNYQFLLEIKPEKKLKCSFINSLKIAAALYISINNIFI